MERGSWVPDKEAAECFFCAKPFKALIRRKHHCRSCGQVFCSKCSSYFQEIKGEKHRLCKSCFHKVTEFIKHGERTEEEVFQLVTDQDSEPSLLNFL